MQRQPLMLLLIICALSTFTAPCLAEVTYAKRGWFTATVKVKNKTPNAVLTVEVSTTPGGTTFIDTGHTITTDANGDGSATIGNVESGSLRKGSIVRVGGVNGNTAVVVAKTLWDLIFANAPGGPPGGMRLAQTIIDDPDGVIDLIETWEAGAIFTVQLDPAEASFVNLGATLATEGDLVATLLSVGPQHVSIQIVQDLMSDIPNDIVIEGLGVNVASGVTELHPTMALTGTQVVLVDSLPPLTISNDGSLSVEQTAIPVTTAYIRGDCNVDSFFDIADAVKALNDLFPSVTTAAPSSCGLACDANNDGQFNIGDPVRMLQALFGVNTTPLPGPFPSCGVSTNQNANINILDCAGYDSC